VARHIDFVYSTALRVVNGDSRLAQDMAQTVFIDPFQPPGVWGACCWGDWLSNGGVFCDEWGMAKTRKNAAAVALGRLGGLKGGKARAAKMTAAERSASARKAVLARWSRAKKPRKKA
jgi:hypothetical protein